MAPQAFPIDLYLKRIGLNTLPSPNVEGLHSLAKAQSSGITFENLDVLANIPIRIDLESISEKILKSGRGGYCFELNGLLGNALQAAGFTFEPRLARVTYRRPEPGPKTHLVYVVKIENQNWLVDVGFGGPGLIEPALFEANTEFEQNGTLFRFVLEKNGEFHLQRKTMDEWIGIYMVTHEPVMPIDLEVVNHFVSTWERSPFRSIFMCVSPRKNGVLTIHGQDLVHLDHNLNAVARRTIQDLADLKEIMNSQFHIQVPDSVLEKAWAKVSQNRP